MNERGGAALYTTEILMLAAELAAFPLEDGLTRRAEAASRVCGSWMTIGLEATDGVVQRAGARVTACAIGQAAAAIFLRAVKGRSFTRLVAEQGEIEAWLTGDSAAPAWPGLTILDPARAYPARHPAIVLPWKAAVAALSNPEGAD